MIQLGCVVAPAYFFLPLLQCDGTIMTSFLLFGRHACPAGSVFGEGERAFAFTGVNSFLLGFFPGWRGHINLNGLTSFSESIPFHLM